MMARIGFTASRDGAADAQDEAMCHWMANRPNAELHHGDCIGGDNSAYLYARFLSWRTVAHPAKVHPSLRAFTLSDEIRPVKPPLDRNRDIVDETTELVALPKGPEEQRSGTWATVRYARKCQRQITIIWPDGSVTVEPAKSGAQALAGSEAVGAAPGGPQ